MITGKLWEKTAYVLTSVGALNWGLDKVFSFNIVDWLLTMVKLTSYSIYVYGLIGLAGAFAVYKIFK